METINDDSYIRLPYHLQDNELFKDPYVFSVWLHLMLTANTEDKETFGLKINRGQVVTSLVSLSVATGIKTQKVEKAINTLQKAKEVKVTKSKGYTIFTMLNFDYYA